MRFRRRPPSEPPVPAWERESVIFHGWRPWADYTETTVDVPPDGLEVPVADEDERVWLYMDTPNVELRVHRVRSGYTTVLWPRQPPVLVVSTVRVVHPRGEPASVIILREVARCES